MVKTAKRAKSFLKKGGISAALKKGTVAKKGKFVMKRKSGNIGNKERTTKRDETEKEGKLTQVDDNDFVSSTSALANMDIESFFREAADKAEEVIQINSATEPDDDDDDEVEKDDSPTNDKKSRDKKETDNSRDDASCASSDMDIEEQERLMKEQMNKLSEDDPDFHNFLSENERTLLEFGKDEEGGEEDDAEETEVQNKKHKVMEADESMEPSKTRASTDIKVLTPSLLKQIERQAFGKDKHAEFSIRALKRLLAAYRTAAHYGDADQEKIPRSYIIHSAVVFDRLMITCLRNFQTALRHHLLLEQDDEIDLDKPIPPKILAKSKNWKTINSLLMSFMTSTLNLLNEGKDSDLLTFVLRSLANYLPYLSTLQKVSQKLLKVCRDLWAAPRSADEDSEKSYQPVRLHAFLRIRQLALTQPFPFVEDCLKAIYLAYAKNAKFMNETSLPTLSFWSNCVIELYSLDLDCSYQHAFVYIRQLALHLRTALQKKTKEALGTVYCAQFMNCCRLWTDVLSAHGRKDGLYSLVYPLTEIIFGVSRLLPTARYLPLRLICVRMLQQLAASTETFIPTTGILLDALQSKMFSAKPQNRKKSNKSKAVIRLDLVLKLSEEAVSGNLEQADICISRIFVDLNREIDLYRYSPAFPEFAARIGQVLRKFSKSTRNGRWRTFAKGCLETCEKFADYAIEERSKLKQAPKDIKRIEVLKPQSAPSMKERFHESVENEKKKQSAMQPSQSKASQKRHQSEAEQALEKMESKRQKTRVSPENKTAPLSERNLDEADDVEEGVAWFDEEAEEVEMDEDSEEKEDDEDSKEAELQTGGDDSDDNEDNSEDSEDSADD